MDPQKPTISDEFVEQLEEIQGHYYPEVLKETEKLIGKIESVYNQSFHSESKIIYQLDDLDAQDYANYVDYYANTFEIPCDEVIYNVQGAIESEGRLPLGLMSFNEANGYYENPELFVEDFFGDRDRWNREAMDETMVKNLMNAFDKDIYINLNNGRVNDFKHWSYVEMGGYPAEEFASLYTVELLASHGLPLSKANELFLHEDDLEAYKRVNREMENPHIDNPKSYIISDLINKYKNPDVVEEINNVVALDTDGTHPDRNFYKNIEADVRELNKELKYKYALNVEPRVLVVPEKVIKTMVERAEKAYMTEPIHIHYTGPTAVSYALNNYNITKEQVREAVKEYKKSDENSLTYDNKLNTRVISEFKGFISGETVTHERVYHTASYILEQANHKLQEKVFGKTSDNNALPLPMMDEVVQQLDRAYQKGIDIESYENNIDEFVFENRGVMQVCEDYPQIEAYKEGHKLDPDGFWWSYYDLKSMVLSDFEATINGNVVDKEEVYNAATEILNATDLCLKDTYNVLKDDSNVCVISDKVIEDTIADLNKDYMRGVSMYDCMQRGADYVLDKYPISEKDVIYKAMDESTVAIHEKPEFVKGYQKDLDQRLETFTSNLKPEDVISVVNASYDKVIPMTDMQKDVVQGCLDKVKNGEMPLEREPFLQAMQGVTLGDTSVEFDPKGKIYKMKTEVASKQHQVKRVFSNMKMQQKTNSTNIKR